LAQESGASAGFRDRGAGRNAGGPAVGARRRLPGPGKKEVPNAGGAGLSPRSGRQACPAGREPLRDERARMPSVRRGGAKPGPSGRWHPRGGAGENGAAGGAPSRQGATPRRDPGDCNASRLQRRSAKRARSTQRTRKRIASGLVAGNEVAEPERVS
jgi:hypothetical protein